jgi:deoxyribose-phosphate aldolase
MENIAQYLDSTNLRISATRDEIKQLIKDAIKYNMAGLCITPAWVGFVKDRLKGTDVKTITVPNWAPGGGLARMSGIANLVMQEVDEVDYILDTYFFYELKDWDRSEKELKYIREHTKGILKIIIEANYVREVHPTENAKLLKQVINLVQKLGADYVKTDSGIFRRGTPDTLIEDVKIMKKYSKLPIKAAGGVRDLKVCKKLIDLGVKRIGTSSAVKIIEEGKKGE